MRVLIVTIPLLFCQIFSLHAMKGRLLLVGGGTERDTPNSWSTPAFQWAIDQSINKKALVVHYETESSFYPGYLTSKCGAIAAKNLIINAANANLQATYDTIMNYDFIFFRGGDQSQYYTYYNNTKTEQAIKDKFQTGGVIGGTSAGLHILSGVIYNAVNQSILPIEALVNLNGAYPALVDDFFGLFPGYIFDSHVLERGRFPRSISFITAWYNKTGKKIKTIAVDDLTAMGIDTAETGTAFGTGTVAIYESIAKRDGALPTSGKLLLDSISAISLLNGWKYDFKGKQLVTTTSTINSIPQNLETPESIVLLSGADGVLSNKVILKNIVRKYGIAQQSVAIIATTADTSALVAYKAELTANGTGQVHIINITDASLDNDSIAIKRLSTAYKLIFINCTLGSLQEALNNGKTGRYIANKISAKGHLTAFIGGNSRFAGSVAISDNYQTADAAYSGALAVNTSLGLLKSFLIIPNAYSSSSVYENAAAAAPYFLLKENLKYSVLLTGDSYFEYKINESGEAKLSAYGTYPAVIFENPGTVYSFSNTTSGRFPVMTPRQASGYLQLKLAFTDSSNAILLGSNFNYSPILYSTNTVVSSMTNTYERLPAVIYPVPAQDELFVVSGAELISVTLTNNIGEVMLVEKASTGILKLDIKDLLPGIYLANLKFKNGEFVRRVVVQK